MVTAAPSTAISGLPRRLVQDGIVSEDMMLQAMDDAREAHSTIVTVISLAPGGGFIGGVQLR